MASPAHVSIPISCQATLISTLILSFAPMLIWPHPASRYLQASSIPTHSSSHSTRPTFSQAPSHFPSPYGGHSNHRSCPPPTATATRRAFCDTDNTHLVHPPFYKFLIATTSETQSSSPASEQPSVDSTFTTNSLSSSETVRPSEAPGSVMAQWAQDVPNYSSEPEKTSSGPRAKIGAGIGIGIALGILIILIAVVLAIHWFRRRQKQNQRHFAAEALECEPSKPSSGENSARSPRVQAEVISSQDRSWLGEGRDIFSETHSLPLVGPRLTALNTTVPRNNELNSSSASKLITTSTSSPGFLGDAHAAFKFLDQSAPVAVVPPTLAKEARSRSPVSPEQSPLGYFSNVPPSPEERPPPNTDTSLENASVDLDPLPLIATKNSIEFYLPTPVLQLESKDAATTTPLTSPSIILNSPQKRIITTDAKRTGERAPQHLRDHPQPLRSYSLTGPASRGTLATGPPNYREPPPSIGNNNTNTPGSNNFTASGGSTTVKDGSSSSSLDATNNDDDPAAIQNFSRKIGSIRSRQVRPPAVHSAHVDTRL